MIIIPYTAILVLIPLYVILHSVFKEFDYKNRRNEIPFKGYHFLLFRKIKSFNTINGNLYYLYHSSDEYTDIIRVYKKKGIFYKLISYEVFKNNQKLSFVSDTIKNMYINSIQNQSTKNTDPYDIKIEYIGTDDEIKTMKRNKNIKTIISKL